VNLGNASIEEKVDRHPAASATPVEHPSDAIESSVAFDGCGEVRERPLAVGTEEVGVVAPGDALHEIGRRDRPIQPGTGRKHRRERAGRASPAQSDDLERARFRRRRLVKREPGPTRVSDPRKRFSDPIELDRPLTCDRRAVHAQLQLVERSVEPEHPADDAKAIPLRLDDVEITARDLSETRAHAATSAAATTSPGEVTGIRLGASRARASGR
jgi:hypothetical protein